MFVLEKGEKRTEETSGGQRGSHCTHSTHLFLLYVHTSTMYELCMTKETYTEKFTITALALYLLGH